MGFSPCHSRIRDKYEFFSKLFSRAVNASKSDELQSLREMLLPIILTRYGAPRSAIDLSVTVH
jgi:hypothetical protein